MRWTTDARVAAAALAEGRLAALPTETVYGLGGRADDRHAIARIYAVKGRPADHPLIVHVLDATAVDAWARAVPGYAHDLAQACWPGPLTIVLPRSARADDFVTGGQDSVALRVPAHPVTQEVLHHLAALTADPSIGVAAPSANRFGRVSPTTAEHVRAELADLLGVDDVILDAGACEVGVESTIIDATGDHPRLLRPGAVTAATVEQITGLPVTTGSPVRASGTLASHYAPAAEVIVIDASELAAEGRRTQPPEPGDARIGLLALAGITTPPGLVRLSAPPTAQAYAQVLYAALREADALGLRRILVVLPEASGIGQAIGDRVRRAANRG